MVRMVGRIKNDLFGGLMKERMVAEGIDIEGIIVQPKHVYILRSIYIYT